MKKEFKLLVVEDDEKIRTKASGNNDLIPIATLNLIRAWVKVRQD